MADPVTGTIAAVGIASAVAGGVVSGIGAKDSANAQAAAMTYKAGVAQLNSQINQQNAEWAVETGAIEGQEAGIRAGQQIAQTKVTQAASGMDVNSGTNAAVRDSQENVAAFDQNVINWNAAKTAWGFQTKAVMNQAESTLDLMGAGNERTAGDIAMTTSFLNAGSNVASKWLQASNQGIFTGKSDGSSNPYYGPLDFNG